MSDQEEAARAEQAAVLGMLFLSRSNGDFIEAQDDLAAVGRVLEDPTPEIFAQARALISRAQMEQLGQSGNF